MKKFFLGFFLLAFIFWNITFWISENQVDSFWKSIWNALIKKVEKWEMTFDKARWVVAYGVKYYAEDLKKQYPKKDSKNNLSAFCIMYTILKEYNPKVEDTVWEYCWFNNVQENLWKKEYTLNKVVDWDTIRVIDENGKSLDVRLIWIDAPEASTQRYWYIECYGEEATKKLEELLKWVKTVEIETDSTQWMEDKYWRLLWYVFLWDENINKKLISLGYWWEYTYDKPYKYQKEFKEAEELAKKYKVWLRQEDTCNGQRVAEYSESMQKTSSSSDSAYSSNTSRSDSLCWNHVWILWPRWWCYYMNWNSKEYWDHSCCY